MDQSSWVLLFLFSTMAWLTILSWASTIDALKLGLPEDDELNTSQKVLVSGRQEVMKELIPSPIREKFTAKNYEITTGQRLQIPFWSSFCVYSTIGISPTDPLGVFSEFGLVFVVLLLMVFINLRSVITRIQSKKWKAVPLVEHRGWRPLSKGDKGMLFIFPMFTIFSTKFVLESEGIERLSLIPYGVMFLMCAVYVWERRLDLRLSELGFHDRFWFIPWKKVLHYRWFEHRRGLLLLTDDPRAESPLLILPVPDGKADEVQALLDDVLPGKREEDVEPALAKLNTGQMAEAV